MSSDATSESLDDMRARNAAAPVSLEEVPALNRRVIEEFRANDGRVTGMFASEPLLLLTTTGAKSGEKRTNPLVHTLDGETFTSNAIIPEGEERQRIYDRHAAEMPRFAEYQAMTTREIPVVVIPRP